MERAEEIALFDKPTARNAIDAAKSAKNELVQAVTEPKTPRARYVVASLILQVTLLGIVAGVGMLVGRHLLALESVSRGEMSAQVEENAKLAELTEKTQALTAQTNSLEAEVANLRKTVSSGTSEDVLFLKIILLKQDVDPTLARSVANSVHHYAMLYDKDPNLVLALISVESNFDPKAVSNVGAVGLMQVMPHWKKVLGITGDLTDPEVNIRYGLQVLGFYEEMYKDPQMVLTAYNRGPGPVDMALMHGINPNNGYAPRVLATYEKLKKLNVQTAGK